MSSSIKSPKPADVLYAELALWAWTAWACLYGIYHTWKQIPEIEDMLTSQLQGFIDIGPDRLLHMAVGGYVSIAIISAFVVYKIGQGKEWARLSLVWGFALEVLIELISAFFEPIEYLSDIPEFGLQIYALYLLYTPASRAWFASRA